MGDKHPSSLYNRDILQKKLKIICVIQKNVVIL